MPLTVNEYDIDKVSFVAASKRDNIYIISYNFVRANIITDKICFKGHKVIFKEDDRSKMKKIFLKLKDNDTYDSDEENENHAPINHRENIVTLAKHVDKLKKVLNKDFIDKSYSEKNPTTSCYYDLVMGIRTTPSGEIYNLINYNDTKYNISLNDFKYLISRDLEFKLEVCPEYFYISKTKSGEDNFRLGLVIRGIHVDEDQLVKFPKGLYAKIKYGATQDKITDIRNLESIYNEAVRPRYTSKRDIVSNIMS